VIPYIGQSVDKALLVLMHQSWAGSKVYPQ